MQRYNNCDQVSNQQNTQLGNSNESPYRAFSPNELRILRPFLFANHSNRSRTLVRSHSFSLVLASLIVCVTTTAFGQQQSTVLANMDSVREVLLKTDAHFSETSVEKGTVDAFLSYIAEDAVLLPMGGNPVKGRENIRKHLSQGSSGSVLSWQPLQAEVANSADLGYTYGTYEVRLIGQDGKPTTRYGKYVTVWRRQPDGSWKFILDIGNQSPPPEPARNKD